MALVLRNGLLTSIAIIVVACAQPPPQGEPQQQNEPSECEPATCDGTCVDGQCTTALCAGIDCNDRDPCTLDSCLDGECQNDSVPDDPETACNIAGLPAAVGVCSEGICIDPQRCEGILCDDEEDCTTDTCDIYTGQCRFSPVEDETVCPEGPGGGYGLCEAGVCVDQMLCEGIECGDGDQCTNDVCDPRSGDCDNAAVPDGAECDFGMVPGICRSGACEDAKLCAGVDCDDGDACTDDDCRPGDGMCQYSGADCNDGDACTTDSCVSASGCSNEPVECPDTDSDPCKVDACSGGDCIVRNAPNGTECTGTANQRQCISIPFGGEQCFNVPLPVTASCVLGDCVACEENADCDDKNACTAQTCSSYKCTYRTDFRLPGCLVINPF